MCSKGKIFRATNLCTSPTSLCSSDSDNDREVDEIFSQSQTESRGRGIFKENKKRRENLHAVIAIACVAWRFWLGALSNKGGRGQRNREEIGAEAIFLAASPLVLARFAREFRCYAARRSCARLDKTAMLRRLLLQSQRTKAWRKL